VHKAALEERGPTPYHRLSWAYLDALPQWRHLKKARSLTDGSVPEIEGQLGFDF
jgi:ribonuclease HII